jgi:hypothetical protein
MADRDPRNPNESFDPANQADESEGVIKSPQKSTEKNVPRGSEPERHARK